MPVPPASTPRRLLLPGGPCAVNRTHLAVIAFAIALAVAHTGLLPVAVFAEPADPTTPTQAAGLSRRSLIPLLVGGSNGANTGARYAAIPVLPPPTDRPATQHADLNLGLRGYSPTSASLGLVNYGGDADPGAPQIPGVFADNRTPAFTNTHRVYEWDWGCGSAGCRGQPITSPEVTLLGMATRPGELLAAPRRGAEIFPGGYTALVLYADERRLTLKYTREDNVISGYTVHLENLSVDQNLLALYQRTNAAGRGELPGIGNGQPLGVASGKEVLAAIRDCGSFLDPRSRKDWWQGR